MLPTYDKTTVPRKPQTQSPCQGIDAQSPDRRSRRCQEEGSATKAKPEPGQRWRCALGGEEDAVEVVRVTEVTVEYRLLRTSTSLTAMLDVFTVLYEPDATPHRRARGGGS